MIIPRDMQELAPRAGLQGLGELPAEPHRLPLWLRVLLLSFVAAVIVGVGVALGLARYGGAYAKTALELDPSPPDLSHLKVTPSRRADVLERRLAALMPRREVYVVVDTHHNRLRVYRGSKLLREAICSTGSGEKLRDPRNGKTWIFDTPQGEMRILRKVKDPIWVKPDWAFIEDGFEPPRGMRDRVDDFSLGDYALYMKDGYIIHGTIFQTLLGKRITHGCVRLGDKDLKFVFHAVPVGARVFLY